MSDLTATTTDALPSLHRILTPDEFHQAKQMSPGALDTAPFPVVPPIDPGDPIKPKPGIKAPLPMPTARSESTAAGLQDPNTQAQSLTGLPRILTKYVAQPIMDHPLAATMTALVPGAGYVMGGLMAKDLTEYGAQKAAEMGLPDDVRKMAEADPNRIPGEQAAVEAVMMGAAPFVHGVTAKAGDALKAANPELAARVSQHVADLSDAWQKIFAPANRTEAAHEAAGILRASTGSMAAQYEQAAFKLDEFRRIAQNLPEDDKLGFIDAIETGKSQPTPEFQPFADVIRKTLDDTRDAIRALGTGKLEHFIQDYFPHIWEDPDRAATAFQASASTGGSTADALGQAKIVAGAKRPMEGSRSFLKERTIPTTLEGMQLGLTPVTTNPVDLTLLKLREMQRYLMAHQSLNEMKDAGLVKFVSSGEQAPDGYSRIDDKIATVFGPREGVVTLPKDAVHAANPNSVAGPAGAPVLPSEVGVPGMRIMGQYHAPEAVATVVNNYLSPGMRGNALYDAYRGLGNTLNQAQLGLSAFHLGFTSMDASVSRAALGLEYMASGDPLTGLAKMASAPVAPVTNMMLGRRIRAAYLNPETASPDMLALANAVKEAGGRVRQDSFYQNSAPERMIAAWKDGEYGKATALSLPALFEYAARPIMEHIVPMQKLGIFGDLAQKALADLPPDATLADRRGALASAWDSVDNRMGQVVYDNLFWNKTFKDLAMASTRSVGWNLGTIRELGGGSLDLAKAAGQVASGDAANATLTHRAAYVMALPITVGLYGALYQYLRTGEGPSELKDYFYPKTGEQDADGNPDRVQLASYMKDFFAYQGHPWETVKHKLSPLLSSTYEMLQNQDFYGDQIRNPDDPAVKQIAQEAEYIGKEFVPFSFRNLSEQSARGDQSKVTKFGNWFGATPAPRSTVRTDAQNKIAEFQSQRQTSGATPEQADAMQTRRDVLGALRGGAGNDDVTQKIADAIDRHQLTPPDVAKLLKRAGMTPAQEKFKGLTLDQALQVFKLANPSEQAKFGELLVKKVEKAAKVKAALTAPDESGGSPDSSGGMPQAP